MSKRRKRTEKTDLSAWVIAAIFAVGLASLHIALIVIAILIGIPAYFIICHTNGNEELDDAEYYNQPNEYILASEFRNADKHDAIRVSGSSKNTPYQYERFCASVLFDNDFTDIEITPASGDFGADIIATDEDGTRWVFQCKYYSGPVGSKAVQEVVSSMAHYGAKRAGVITNSRLTANAKLLAQENGVMVCEYIGKNCEFHLIMDELRYK